MPTEMPVPVPGGAQVGSEGGGADQPVVALRGISKSFGAIQALKGVDLDVLPGEVHSLCGENGAGKSTLLKIMFGAQPADEGEVLFEGRSGVLTSPRNSLQAGFAMIAQELALVPEFTVAQNIALGQEPLRAGTLNWRRINAEAREALAAVGVGDVDVRRRTRDLSIAQRQLVEVARAAHRGARVVVMDEPTSSLPAHEVEELLHVVERLSRQGTAVVYVSHRLDEVMAVSHRVTVLRDGRHVATVSADETDQTRITNLMVGRELADVHHRSFVREDSPVVLEVKGIGRRGVVESTSLSVRAGEVVGIAGLVGAGRTELARLLFGADQADQGTVRVDGHEFRPGSPQSAMEAGIALLPEDRKDQGLVLGMTVMSNITLPILDRVRRLGVLLDQGRRRRMSGDLAKQVHLRPPRIQTVVGNLSGGNQQKVVIAKWLATKAKVFIFDEPTRGIDVGGKAEVYRLMDELAERGAALIMISSELPEVLLMSDRVLVMRAGRVVLDVPRSEATEESVGRALIGAGERMTVEELAAEFGDVPSPSRSYRIGVLVKDLGRQHWREMSGGYEAAAAKYGVEVVIRSDDAGPEERVQTVRDLLAQGVDALSVSPASTSGLQPLLDELRTSGLPVVNVDDAQVAARAYLGANQRAAGVRAARLIAELLPHGGEVAQVVGDPASPAAQQRSDGFASEVAKHPRLKLVTSVPADWDRQKALDATTNILRANPNVKAFYANNDTMALGVVEAVRNAGKVGQVLVVGTDGVPDAVDAVRTGDMTGTVATFPYRMGYAAVEVAIRLLEGQEVPAELVSWQELVTRDNAAALFPVTGGPPEDRRTDG